MKRENSQFLNIVQSKMLQPEEARICESKFNSSQNSPFPKEKEGFSYQTNEYDLTQKKQSTYFPNLK